jgi:hypothetical protein
MGGAYPFIFPKLLVFRGGRGKGGRPRINSKSSSGPPPSAAAILIFFAELDRTIEKSATPTGACRSWRRELESRRLLRNCYRIECKKMNFGGDGAMCLLSELRCRIRRRMRVLPTIAFSQCTL